MLCPFDRSLAGRAVVASLLFGVVGLGVVAATDEPYSTAAMRAARLSALAPAFTALGGLVVLAQARARGETIALAALGARPWRIALGVLLAGWLLGIVAVVLVVSPLADASTLFPATQTPADWAVMGGALVEHAQGVRVLGDGSIELLERAPLPAAGARVASGTAAALLVAPLALAVPPWAAAPLGVAGRGITVALSTLTAVVVVHAFAAGRIGAPLLPLAAVPLALQAGLALLRGAPASSERARA